MPTPRRAFRKFRVYHLTIGLVLLLTSSCASVGPKTIPRDQFDYGQAIANSWKEQLLLNVVGLRYVEAPVFVNVSSVINQYSLEGEVALGGGFSNSFTGGHSATLGGAVRYADRPTITYTPVSGQDFARSLLTPIPPESLFALVQAGWAPEIIMRLTVTSMNGIDNEWASPFNRQQADPRFVELMKVWGRLRKARVLGLRREASQEKDAKKKGARIIVFQTGREMTQETQDDLRFLQEALGLDPNVEDYPLSYGLVPDEKNEIMVMTSSILEIINELAWRVDIPPDHIQEGRTGSTFESTDGWDTPMIRVHYSDEEPKDSYVAVRLRDHWFYIDDRDVLSKRTFAIVQIVLSLTDSGETGRGPVVSITN